MREFDALRRYPKAAQRAVDERGIANKLIASERGKEFFDGWRANGYGGLKDDGRWGPVADDLIDSYRLRVGDDMPACVLQVQAEKGFLLKALRSRGVYVCGTETSPYAIENAEVGLDIAWPTKLPYTAGSFDLALAIGPVYTGSLTDAVQTLRELCRVSRRHAFVTLGAWESKDDFWLMRQWSLLGTSLLAKSEWLEVMRFAGYTGDYSFVTAQTLGLA